jgi:hypothetical protein
MPVSVVVSPFSKNSAIAELQALSIRVIRKLEERIGISPLPWARAVSPGLTTIWEIPTAPRSNSASIEINLAGPS